MPTVLIIEDYELNMKLVEDLMNFSGYRTYTAYTAEEGLQIAQEVRPDLILMDMRLSGPGMDGWTATKTIKHDRNLAHIPVIALTAQVWDGERERAFEVGCNDYISKPFNIHELQNCVSRHLQASASS